jgi:hypothetical protein
MTSTSLLSEFEVKYPFAPTSRKVFEKLPFEESLASEEVLQQSESRLLTALGKQTYERHLSHPVEFISFFAAAFIASEDRLLTSKFASNEAVMSSYYFVKEGLHTKLDLMKLCFGIELKTEGKSYLLPFEHYLERISRFDLTRLQRWKLGRQNLISGIIHLDENKLTDLFVDCAKSIIVEGVTNLRRGSFPPQLIDLKAKILSVIPRKERPYVGKYSYIEELFKHPVSDGRHRLVWLVLAPYLVNVKRLDEVHAADIIRNYVSVAGESRDMKRFIEYNVRRAKRNGLMPPTLATLKNEHPDVYALLPLEVKSKGH